MVQNDNWGWRGRIGLFIVGSEAVPEAEWWAMAPPDVSIHAARVTARAPWAEWQADCGGIELAADLVHGCTQFKAMQLSAVVVGHSSSSILGGTGWDEAVVAALTARLGPGVAVTTNGLDSLEAMRATGIVRTFLVLPPWFGDDLVAAALRYYVERGFPPAGHMRTDPGRGWRDLRPDALYASGMGFAQQIEPLHAQIRAACPPEADGVFIAGTGLRCVGILSALEQDLQRPVLSANQVSLWNCLRLAGVGTPVGGYGALLDVVPRK